MKYSNTVDCALESTLPISGKLTPFIRGTPKQYAYFPLG